MADPTEVLQKGPQNGPAGLELIKAPTPIPVPAPVSAVRPPAPVASSEAVAGPATATPGPQRKPWTFRNIFKGRRGPRNSKSYRERRGRAYYIRRQKRSGEPIPPSEQVRPQPTTPSAPGIPPSSAAIRNLGGTSVRSAIEQAKQKYTALYGALSDGLYTQELEVLGERVALKEEDYDFESQKDIVSFTAAYFPEFAGDAQIEEAKVVFSKVFSPRGHFSPDAPLPPCASEEAKILLKGLRNRFETLRADVLRRRDVYGDSIYTREGLEHVLRLKALIERLEDEEDCYDYDAGVETKAAGRQLVIDDERLRNLVRQFVFMVLQSTNGLPEFKGKEVMDPVEFVEMLEKRSMSEQEMKDYIALQAGRNFKIPALFARILKLLEGDNSAVSIFLESELADLVEHVRSTIEGNLKQTDKSASKQLFPEFRAFVQTLQKRPAREQLYEMLVWILQAFTRARADLDTTQEFLDTLQFKYGTAVKLAAETQDELNTLKGQYTALKQAYEKFKEDNGSLQQKVNANFDLAAQTSEEAKSQEEAYKAQFKELQRRIAEYTLELQRLNASKQELEGLLDRDRSQFKTAQEEVARLSGVLSKLELDLKAKTDDNSALVERVKELQTKLTEYERAAIAKVDTHETEIRSLKDQLQAANAELQRRVGEYDAQIANYKTQLDALQRGVAGTAAADAILTDLRQRLDRLTQEKGELQRKLDACVRQGAESSRAIVPYKAPTTTQRGQEERAIVPYKGPSREMVELSTRLDSITRQRDELQRQIEQMKRTSTQPPNVQGELVAVRKQLDDITKERDQLLRQRKALDTDLTETRKRLTDVTGQMSRLEQERQTQLAQVKALENQLATKRPTFTQQFLAIEDVKRDERAIQALRDDIAKKDIRLRDLQGQVTKLLEDQTGLRAAEEKRKQIEAALEERAKEIRALTDQVADLNQTKRDLQTSETSIVTLRNQVAERDRAIAEMKARMEELGTAQRRLGDLKRDQQELQQRIADREQQIVEYKRQLEDRATTTRLLAIGDQPTQLLLEDQKKEEKELEDLRQKLDTEQRAHANELDELRRRNRLELEARAREAAERTRELTETKRSLETAIRSGQVAVDELAAAREKLKTVEQQLLSEQSAVAQLNDEHRKQVEELVAKQKELEQQTQEELQLRDTKLREMESMLQQSKEALGAKSAELEELEKQSALTKQSFEEAQQRLEEQMRTYETERDTMKQQFEGDLTQREQELADRDQQIKAYQADLEKSIAAGTATEEELKQSKSVVATLERDLATERAALEAERKAAEERLAELTRAQEEQERVARDEVERARKEIAARDTQLEELKKRLTYTTAAGEAALSASRKRIEELEAQQQAEVDKLKQTQLLLEDQKSAITDELTQLRERTDLEIQKKNDELAELRNRSIELSDQVGKKDDTISALKGELDALSKEGAALKEARDALAKDFEAATEQLRDLAVTKETLTRQTQQLADMTGRISELTGQLADTEEKTKDLTAKLTTAAELLAQRDAELKDQREQFVAQGELAAAKAKEFQERIATLEAEKTELVSKQTSQLQQLQESIEQERAQMAEAIQKQNDAIQTMRAKIAALTGVVEIAKKQHAAEVDELKRTHGIERAKLIAERDEVAAKLAGLQDTIQTNEEALAAAKAERDQLRAAEEALRAEYKKQKDTNSQQAITLQNQINVIGRDLANRDATIQEMDALKRDADAEVEGLRSKQATLSAQLADRMNELQEKDATLASQAEQLEELADLKEQRETMTAQLAELNEQLTRQRGELTELRKTRLDEETSIDLTKERDELIAAINALEDTIGSVQTELQVKQTQIDELEKTVEGAREEARARGETISKFQQRSKQLEVELRQQRTGMVTKLQGLAEAIQMGADTGAVQSMFPGEEGAVFRDIYSRMQKREQALRKTIAENPRAAAPPLSSRDVCYLNYMITIFIKQFFFNHPDIRVRTKAFQDMNTLLDTFVGANGGTAALPTLIEECFKLLKAAESHFVAKQSKAGIPITNLTRGLYVLEGMSARFLASLYQFLKPVEQFSRLQTVLNLYFPIAFPNLGFTGTTLVFNPPPEEPVDPALNGHPNFLYLQEPDVEREDPSVFERYTKLDATGKETIVRLKTPLVPSAFLEHGISYPTLFACFLLLSRKYVLSIEPLLNRYQCSIPQFLRDPNSVVPLFAKDAGSSSRGRVLEKTDVNVIEANQAGGAHVRRRTQSEPLGLDLYTELRAELSRLRALEDRGSHPSKRTLLILRSQIQSYRTLSKTDTDRARAERLRQAFNALLDETDGVTLHGVSILS